MEQSFIHTTVNMRIGHAALIEESARVRGMHKSRLIALLLRKMTIHAKKLKHEFEVVKYQERGGEWNKVHFFPEKKEYEVFTDMRNNCKFSVSFLLAMAIEWFLEEILRNEETNVQTLCDKYQIQGYKCREKVDINYFCWHTVWLLDDDLAKIINK